MQVQRPVHLESRHGHHPADATSNQSNGIHSNSGSNHPASTNGHSNGDNMNPYHPHYASGQDGSQPRQYPPAQLPPLYSGMNIAPMAGPGIVGPGGAAQPAMYPPATAAQLAPPPMQPRPQPQMMRIGSNDKYTYELKVEQQPQRARMCGFGDKDRRPITPPPAVLLIIRHKDSNEPVNVNEIEGGYFVLSVDLYGEDAITQQTTVKSSSSSPAVSISSATTTGFPPPPERIPVPEVYHPVGYTADGQPIVHPPQAGYAAAMGRVPYAIPGNAYGYPTAFAGAPPGAHPQHMYAAAPSMVSGHSNVSMYTKNLIGSLSANAAVLKDLKGQLGFWFVLQDLSVRTEGFFRLKMTFIDVANAAGPGVTKGTAPVLAHIFSDKFQVFSAKKFPGVIESTPLSKCFAAQGIKIPIRKDGARLDRDDDDD